MLLRIIVFCIVLCCYSCKSDEEDDHVKFLDTIIEHGDELAKEGKPYLIKKYLDSVQHNTKNLGLGDKWRLIYEKYVINYNLGLSNKNLKNFDTCLVYTDSLFKLISLAKNIKKYDTELRTTKFATGDAFLELNNYRQAYTYIYQAKLMADKNGDQCLRYEFNRRFGLLYARQQKYKESATLYMEAYNDKLKCTPSFGSFMSTLITLTNAGTSFIKSNQTDSAFIALNLAIKYFNSNNSLYPVYHIYAQNQKGIIFHQMAEAYLQRKQLAEAELFLKKSIDLNQTFGNKKLDAQLASLSLGRIYLQQGRTSATKLILKKTRKSLDTLPHLIAEKDWQLLMYDHLLVNGKESQVAPYLKKFLQLKEQENRVEREIKTTDAGQEFYNLKKDYEVDLLKKENQLRNLYLFFSIGIVFMAFLLIFILARSINASKANVIILNKGNRQIIEQNGYLHQALQTLELSQEENNRLMQINYT